MKKFCVSQKTKRFQFTLRSVPVTEKIFFVQNLALMIKTGFSIGEALHTLSEQTGDRMLRKVILDLHAQIVRGLTFAEALATHSAVFDELFVNMVAAGEASGNLEKTLFQIVYQLKKSYTLKKKIRGAMIYPSVILFAMVVVGTGMFIFVIPKIVDLYSSGGYTLPLPTRILLAGSTFVQANIWWLAILALLGLASFGIGLHTAGGRHLWHRVLLRLPILGTTIKRVNVARFSRVLNSLIITDIPIVKSFQIIATTLNNRVYRTFIQQSTDKLAKGNSISSLLAVRPDLFEPVVTHMIKVGEEAGVLDTMTSEIANFYEDEVDSTLANLTVIIEPVLMIVIGAGVGFFAVAIILPIYALVDEI